MLLYAVCAVCAVCAVVVQRLSRAGGERAQSRSRAGVEQEQSRGYLFKSSWRRGEPQGSVVITRGKEGVPWLARGAKGHCVVGQLPKQVARHRLHENARRNIGGRGRASTGRGERREGGGGGSQNAAEVRPLDRGSCIWSAGNAPHPLHRRHAGAVRPQRRREG